MSSVRHMDPVIEDSMAGPAGCRGSAQRAAERAAEHAQRIIAQWSRWSRLSSRHILTVHTQVSSLCRRHRKSYVNAMDTSAFGSNGAPSRPPQKLPSAQPSMLSALSMAAARSLKPSSCKYSVSHPSAIHGIVPTMPCAVPALSSARHGTSCMLVAQLRCGLLPQTQGNRRSQNMAAPGAQALAQPSPKPGYPITLVLTSLLFVRRS